MTSTEVLTCLTEDCDRTDITARGMCRRHYNKWLRHNPREPRGVNARTMTDVVHNIDEFEHILRNSRTPLAACDRLGRHPRTIIRWYRRAGRELPDGIWAAYNLYTQRNL